ncbi:hypothetical protein BCV69DRAFT_98284 [Microstroma glucosiphilum]|uniref:Uncharacterized protein n=1 Tax=Pseudomicrostroma glucosiphilum TaxID=1684307 RepID=A0A316UD97_9BASI|nr:hypothetical protein BCV69DRAFT_98284 [Pseudomicrostroma glucosiphilum]PWN22814.1 hypothetical protein BCV69DRAFT_98284 [Pseudomicrostroma glucosiphilum]
MADGVEVEIDLNLASTVGVLNALVDCLCTFGLPLLLRLLLWLLRSVVRSCLVRTLDVACRYCSLTDHLVFARQSSDLYAIVVQFESVRRLRCLQAW